jgi:carbamoyltransferase
LLNAFYAKTNCPALINTSFNVRGEPPVLSPKDAYRCFMSCHLDVLVIGDFILLKEDQPEENRKIPIFDLD